jgi:hypothetical protein
VAEAIPWLIPRTVLRKAWGSIVVRESRKTRRKHTTLDVTAPFRLPLNPRFIHAKQTVDRQVVLTP